MRFGSAVSNARALVGLAAFALALAGCGGGDDASAGSARPPTQSSPLPGAGQVTISGRITYDFVPHGPPNGGLDYTQTEARPARDVTVQFVAGSQVVASARTDANGSYSFNVDADRSGFVRARAESTQSGPPGWTVRVVDNTDGDAIYTLDGAVASSGSSNSQRDLHADSGWTGVSYGNERAAAPFAILDTIHEAIELLSAADPTIALPPLVVHWSPDNEPAYGADGNPDPATGEIGTSFYSDNPLAGTTGIYLLGAENSDTEEYDRHVIVHEFGHYLERKLGRSDSIGGPHTFGDRLDMRVAFSEGWATAFAAIALDDPAYRDAIGPMQAYVFPFNVESAGPNAAAGWYSEQSVIELIYDLADAAVDGSDGLTYPFADIWSVMTGAIATTPALTSIFPFLNAIKNDHPGDGPLLDQLAAAQQIASISTDFGDNETNDGGTADVLPIFTDVQVNGPAVNLCSTDDHRSVVTGSTNKLGSRRYLRFTPPAAGDVTITMTATSIPAGEFADPDFWIHRQGPVAVSDGPPSAACMDVNGAGWTPSACEESSSGFAPAETHVLEIYEWTNTNADDDPEFPPIGKTCFDVTVMQP